MLFDIDVEDFDTVLADQVEISRVVCGCVDLVTPGREHHVDGMRMTMERIPALHVCPPREAVAPPAAVANPLPE